MPPVPPPDSAPPAEDLPSDGEKVEEQQPTSKYIAVFQKHVKVDVFSHVRKFEDKVYGFCGKHRVSLWACEFYEQYAKELVSEFDRLISARKPEERVAMLKSVGCDSKFYKSKTTVQRMALLRRMCVGLAFDVERKVINSLIEKCAGDMSISGMSIKPVAAGFWASFTGEKHAVEKSFANFMAAMDWLRSMRVAERVGWVLKY